MKTARTAKEVLVSKLVPYSRNARTHSDEQIDVLVASIQRFGWTNPILINRKNEIIAGHGRVAAAKKLGMETVPALRVDDMTADEQRAYILADNRTAELAGWDKSLLKLELGELLTSGFELGPVGFTLESLGRLGLGEPSAADTESAAPQLGGLEYSIVVRCRSEEHQRDTLLRLEQEGLTVQALIS
jgi:ParB-like chromosome segregation protein Spo0J